MITCQHARNWARRTSSAAWPSVVVDPGSANSYGTAQRWDANSFAISACTAYASGSTQVAHAHPRGMSAALNGTPFKGFPKQPHMRFSRSRSANSASSGAMACNLS